jgi:HAD superfamily hydrolase (TIGR01490 family)
VPPIYAFFDFDDTLLHGDSILFWLRFYYGHKPSRRFFQILNWGGVVLYLLRCINSATLKRIFLMPMAYETPAELDRLGEAFMREDLTRRFYAPVLQRLWTHHRLGHRIVVISASATFYLRHLKVLLPMAEILGTEMTWPKEGWLRFPGFHGGNLRGANKILRLQALGFGENAPLSFAYSDHDHDAFLLGFAEFPVCVRPNAGLQRMAREKNWPVWDWPREIPPWREKLGRLGLLVFAAGAAPGQEVPTVPSGNLYPSAEKSEADYRALRERVAVKYSEAVHPDVFQRIFGASPML